MSKLCLEIIASNQMWKHTYKLFNQPIKFCKFKHNKKFTVYFHTLLVFISITEIHTELAIFLIGRTS